MTRESRCSVRHSQCLVRGVGVRRWERELNAFGSEFILSLCCPRGAVGRDGTEWVQGSFLTKAKQGWVGSGAPRELPKREMLSAMPQENQVSGWVVCADSNRSKFDDNPYKEITDLKLPSVHILAYF